MRVVYFICLYAISLSSIACQHTDGSSVAEETDRAKSIDSDTSLTVIGLDGRSLYPPVLPEATHLRYDSLLAIARSNYQRDPDQLEHIIWLGRRTAYLWRYQEAIRIYTEGLKKFPESPELFRHRGHRYISTRQLDKAIADFSQAAKLAEGRPVEIEADGLPNRLNIPLSNLQFNIYYHWGLAYYLQADFEKAATIYERCMSYSDNDDLLTATADWLYMAYRRAGEKDKANAVLASITPDMEIIENDAYFQRLLMYKGLKDPGDLINLDQQAMSDDLLNLVTQGYGVGNWFLYNGDEDRARDIFNKILTTEYWSAFGYIAAEADQREKQ